MPLVEIDSVAIDHKGGGTRTLHLCQGDITKMTAQDAVDFICVSALPGDYTPSSGSVIGALARAGVSVQHESQNKAATYEPTMPCWVSQDLSSANLNFERFILFEPPDPKTNAGWQIPAIYRALRCFEGKSSTSIALPMVSTGSGEADLAVILRQLFFIGAHFGSQPEWPLMTIKLVVFSESQLPTTKAQFAAMKTSYLNPPLSAAGLAPILAEKLTARLSEASVALPANMTQRQYNCVRAYTGSAYSPINSALRAESLTDSQYIHWLPAIEGISSGLANLPDFTGLTLRGTNLPQSVIAKYKVGAIITHVAFTSTSRDNPWWGNSLLKITSKEGKDVESISYFPSEHEVLYDYGMNDQVTKVEGPSQGYSHVFLSTQVITDWCGKGSADIQQNGGDR